MHVPSQKEARFTERKLHAPRRGRVAGTAPPRDGGPSHVRFKRLGHKTSLPVLLRRNYPYPSNRILHKRLYGRRFLAASSEYIV